MNVLFAASIEAIITVLIFLAISAVSSWLKRKQAGEAGADEAPAPPPAHRGTRPAPPQRTAPETQPTSWEEELRRMLEGESSPPAPRPLPQPVPGPPPVPRRVVAPPPPRLVEVPCPDSTEGHGLHLKLAGLKHSTEAYEKASQIEKHVEERLKRVDQLLASHAAVVVPHALSARAARLRAMLRDREQVRSAVIASVVLGPPKALEA